MVARTIFAVLCSIRLLSAQGFTPTGSMNEGRSTFAATLLNNGSVLVTGGGRSGSDVGLSTAEIYDPATGTWRYTAFPMNSRRFGHTSTKLSDGRVLIVGGGDVSVGAEIFDPTTERFTPTPPMNSAHATHRATLLKDGRVFITAGYLTNICEIYDPISNTWTLAAPLPTLGGRHDAVLLSDGSVLISGGHPDCCTPMAAVSSYNPTTNTWRAMAPMLVPRLDHTMTVLPNGQILIVGGTDTTGTVASVELYDPNAGVNGQSQFANPLASATRAHTATLLPSGDVLIAGGEQSLLGGFQTSLMAAQVFQHSTQTWSSVQTMATARDSHVATLLPSGQVLLAGGVVNVSGLLKSAELWSGSVSLRNPIILIHGFCSSPKAFGSMQSLLSGEGLHVYSSFDYSQYSLSSIEQIAYRFGQYVEAVRTQEGASQVDVIAHSEGGLIARAWMTGLQVGPPPLLPYHRQIARLATIGTPHYGIPVDVASASDDEWNLFSLASGEDCSRLQAEQMFYGSDFISRLHDEWEIFQQSTAAIPTEQLLFIAGTDNDNCNGFPDFDFVSSGTPCNDGLVDVDSAVLPTASLSNVRYVPYRHDTLPIRLQQLFNEFTQGEADIADSSHKTYLAINSWLLTGSPVPQCCGPNTIDYTPSFFTDLQKEEGFLLLRFKYPPNAPTPGKLTTFSLNPAPPSKPYGFFNSNNLTDLLGLTVTKLPAPNTYDISIQFEGYNPLSVHVPLAFNRPTVPPAITLSLATAAISWSDPAEITFGSALGAGQLNATANLPGTFVYNPPAGTVLSSGGGQVLSVTFTPTDTVHYNASTAAVHIDVLRGPQSGPAQLITTRLLTRDLATNDIILALTVANTGGATALNVQLLAGKIGGTASKTALPISLGAISPGSSVRSIIRFPGYAGSLGTSTTVTITGSYTNGSFSSTGRVILP